MVYSSRAVTLDRDTSAGLDTRGIDPARSRACLLSQGNLQHRVELNGALCATRCFKYTVSRKLTREHPRN
ncbi:hypothetical protein EYF80_026941 [Liparis tanakae]|uniref:Uncharacterized protein n=1 Tax=Liparis tanakae TaxID=230148 RepID=A0A4Z2HAS4_9TELE|nr:hypothetical protein EYF80_026941 [Liparis tanakae]